LSATNHRVLIPLLSVTLAAGVFVLLGLHEPAARLLHRWFFGLALLFILFFALALISLPQRVAGGLRIFPASIVLSYFAATAAYLTYFLMLEPERFANAIRQDGFVAFIQVQLFCASAALVWAFGISVAVIFWGASRLFVTSSSIPSSE